MPNKVEIQIVFDTETGNVSVNGPVHNKVLCYGILKSAEVAIAQFNPTEQPAIIHPRFQIPPSNGNGGG